MMRPFITAGEIVEMASIHPNTLAIWRKTKKIVPRDRVGSSYLYDRKEVMDFLKRRSKKTKRGRKPEIY